MLLLRHGLLASSLLTSCSSLRLPIPPPPWPAIGTNSITRQNPQSAARAAADANRATFRLHRCGAARVGHPAERTQPLRDRGQALPGSFAEDVPVTANTRASWRCLCAASPSATTHRQGLRLYAMTAHISIPHRPSYAVVRNPKNRRRGGGARQRPRAVQDSRVIDLSHAAAYKLGISGIARSGAPPDTVWRSRSDSWKPAAQLLSAKRHRPDRRPRVHGPSNRSHVHDRGEGIMRPGGMPSTAARCRGFDTTRSDSRSGSTHLQSDAARQRRRR